HRRQSQGPPDCRRRLTDRVRLMPWQVVRKQNIGPAGQEDMVVGTRRSETPVTLEDPKGGRSRDDASSAHRALIWPKGIGDLVVSIFAHNDCELPTQRLHLLVL